MKYSGSLTKFAAIFLVLVSACSPVKRFSDYENVEGRFIENGVASWYGPNFNGKTTANGEIFDMDRLTAAHRTLPFNSIVKVINESNGKSVIVRINDRGPYAKNRIIDLSKLAADRIDMIASGTARVKLYLLSDSRLPDDIKNESFTVQIGSFAKKDDAVSLTKIVDNSIVVKAIVDGSEYFRVYSGKFNNRRSAEEYLNTLNSKGISGFVKQFEN
jgi:rare lipoprotein A